MPPPVYKFVSYDLDTCLKVPEVLDGLGGVGNADQVAHHLGYSGKNNGAFLTKMANARLFGLVDGSGENLQPSPLAIQILRPDYPETEAKARLKAFESVNLFKQFLDYYHGQVLPDQTGMRNALETRWQIDKDRSAMVLARLLDSAEQAGLFSTAGNRTKMIRPTLRGGAGTPTPAPESPEKVTVAPPAPVVASTNDVRSSKLIDGALDMLPPTDTPWNEDEFKQWLGFFTSALRVVYKLPEPKPTLSERAGVSP